MSLRLVPTEQQDRPVPAVELLPPHAAYDYEFMAARLHDRALLLGAVAVRIHRAPLLAVPVGGCRRGGRLEAGPIAVALAVHAALQYLPGFPLLRVSPAEHEREGMWLVEWGEHAPDCPLESPDPSCQVRAVTAAGIDVSDHRRAAGPRKVRR